MESGYVTMASAALTALKSSCGWACWVEGECLLSQDAMNLCNSPQPPLTALCCPSKKQEPKRSSSTTIEVSVKAIATSHNHTFVETTTEVHNVKSVLLDTMKNTTLKRTSKKAGRVGCSKFKQTLIGSFTDRDNLVYFAACNQSASGDLIGGR